MKLIFRSHFLWLLLFLYLWAGGDLFHLPAFNHFFSSHLKIFIVNWPASLYISHPSLQCVSFFVNTQFGELFSILIKQLCRNFGPGPPGDYLKRKNNNYIYLIPNITLCSSNLLSTFNNAHKFPFIPHHNLCQLTTSGAS